MQQPAKKSTSCTLKVERSKMEVIFYTESRWDHSMGVIEGGMTLGCDYVRVGCDRVAAVYEIEEELGIPHLLQFLKENGAVGPEKKYYVYQGSRGARTMHSEYEVLGSWAQTISDAVIAIEDGKSKRRLLYSVEWTAWELGWAQALEKDTHRIRATLRERFAKALIAGVSEEAADAAVHRGRERGQLAGQSYADRKGKQ